MLANSKIWACLGDSIALNAPTRSPIPWTAVLDRKIAPMYGTAARGKNSTTTSEWLTRYGATIDTFGFHGIVIGPCAFNDANTGVDPATSFSNIDAIRSDALGRGMKVIIVTGLPAASTAGWNGTKQAAHATLRASILALASDPNLAIVDAYPTFGSAGDATILDTKYQDPNDLDGTHIGQYGGEVLAGLIYTAHRSLIQPTALSVVVATSAGVAISETSAAAGDGNSFTNTGRELLFVTNGGTSDMGVYVEPSKLMDGQLAARVATVPAGARRVVGPFPPGVYNDSTGKARVHFTGVDSVTAAVVRF